MTSSEDRYAAIVDALTTSTGAQRGADVDPSRKGFGSSGQLRLGGKIFAMLVRGRLVVKLPARRVDELVASGAGQHFDPGKGRLMREWLSLEPTSNLDWLALAQEALDFSDQRRRPT